MPLIPATQEEEMRGFLFKTIIGKSWQDPASKTKSGVVAHICDPNYIAGR
jgi:hypothetical protein